MCVGAREAGINLFVLRGGIFEGIRTNQLGREAGDSRSLEVGILKKIGALKTAQTALFGCVFTQKRCDFVFGFFDYGFLRTQTRPLYVFIEN